MFPRIISCISVLLLFCVTSISAQKDVDSLIASFPAKNQQDLERLVGEVMKLGTPAIVSLSKKIRPIGSGEDTNVRYALSALVKGPAEHRQQVEAGFIQALAEDIDLEAQVFLIEQLQFVASDASVDVLASKIRELCEPAAQTLGVIHSPKSVKALLEAVAQVNGYCKQILTKALSNQEGAQVVSKLIDLADDKNALYRAEALLALAKSGSDVAKPSLLAYAKESPVEGNDLLMRFAQKQTVKGNISSALETAQNILSANPSHANKIAAYQLLFQHGSDTETDQLAKTFKKADAATQTVFSSLLVNAQPALLAEFFKQIDKVDANVQMNLLRAALHHNYTAAIPTAKEMMYSENEHLAQVALRIYSALSGKASLPELQNVLLKSNYPSLRVSAQYEASQWVDSSNLDFLAETLSKSSGDAKVNILRLIGERGFSSFWEQVKSSLTDSDPQVRAAAYAALPGIAHDVPIRHLTTVSPLLNSESERNQLREAFSKKVAMTGDRGEISKPLIETFGKSGRKLLEDILPAIGGNDALDYIKLGDDPEPLLAWQGWEAIHDLFPLLKQSATRDQAYSSIMRLVGHPDITADQQVLHLRTLMEYAADNEERSQILSRLGRSKTHTAFKFVESFLGDSLLQTDAASALVSIALPATGEKYGLTGADVKNTLMRVDTILSQTDQDYTLAFLHQYLAVMPEGKGFVSMFNGKDLTGWKALVANPLVRDSLFGIELQKLQREADAKLANSWKVVDGKITFFGDGFDNLVTDKKYRDFEMLLDWKIEKDGDSGLYLRGSPQIQIWDPDRDSIVIGSGALFNNQVHASQPLVTADNPVGAWNTFRIVMIDDKVTVYLNGQLVTDNVVLENYWDRSRPIFRDGQIELQAHTTPLEFRDLYIRTLDEVPVMVQREVMAGYESLFNGVNLDGWIGNKVDYVVEDGAIAIQPGLSGGSGNLYTEKEYSDFILKFEFQLTPGANNGLGIHAPLEGDAAYLGKELQILDNTAEKYAKLQPYQYHGSVYGLLAASRGALNPVGQWNEQEVAVKGNRFTVILNGQRILHGDIDTVTRGGTADGKDHPGIKRLKGHIGFLGHGSEVHFRNIRILDQAKEEAAAAEE